MITVDMKRFKLKPGARVLDIGCGSGRHVGEAAALKDIQVMGTDIGHKDLLEAKERMAWLEAYGAVQGEWALSLADIRSLPFADGFFDLVICSEVLEHIPDDRRAVSELLRVLKPNAPLAVSVPRYLPEKICWNLSVEYQNTPGGHVRIYRKKELLRLLKGAGAAHCSTCFAHSLHTPYWWLKCLCGVNREDAASVKLYHRFLLWDMMKKPKFTRTLEKILNPFMGKSMVFYLEKRG